MLTSDYDEEEVEEVYDTFEEVIENDGKGETYSIITGDWNSVIADKSYRTRFWATWTEKEKSETSNVQMDVLSPKHGLKTRREYCISGKNHKTEINMSWTRYM
jgi:hypothetical protein